MLRTRLPPAYTHSVNPSLFSPSFTLSSTGLWGLPTTPVIGQCCCHCLCGGNMTWFHFKLATKIHQCTCGTWPARFCVTAAVSPWGMSAQPLCSSVIKMESYRPMVVFFLSLGLNWLLTLCERHGEDWQQLQRDMRTYEKYWDRKTEDRGDTYTGKQKPQKDAGLNASCCCLEGNCPTSCSLSIYLHRGRIIFHRLSNCLRQRTSSSYPPFLCPPFWFSVLVICSVPQRHCFRWTIFFCLSLPHRLQHKAHSRGIISFFIW